MNPNTTPAIDAERFFSVLFEPGDIIETRFFPSKARRWFGSYLELCAKWSFIEAGNNSGEDCYFGANPRKSHGVGDAAGVALARCLFVDIDAEINEKAVWTRIEEAGLPEPTAIVFSGHGWHVYWRLAEPVVDAEKWSVMQRRLIAAMGADHKVHDFPRIMRIPGTHNVKGGTRVMATLNHCAGAGESVWPLESFDAALPEVKSIPVKSILDMAQAQLRGERGKLAYATQEFLALGATAGERNARLFRAACDMQGCGWPFGEAVEMLSASARRSGLDDEEITKTIESAWGKPRSPAKPQLDEMPEGGFCPIHPDDLAKYGGGGCADAVVSQSGTASVGGGPLEEREIIGVQPTPEKSQSKAKSSPGGFFFGSDWISLPPGARPVLANSVHISGTDDAKAWQRHVPASVLADSLYEMTGKWPRIAGGQLFVPAKMPADGTLPGPGTVHRLDSTDEFFAWVNHVADVHWTKKEVRSAERMGRTALTKGEFVEYVRQHPGMYHESVEMMPHEPPVASAWYAPCRLPDDDGESLAALLARVNSDTDIDRVLVLSAILTGAWGGPCGARPAMLFTSAHGRGVGKTSTAMILANIWGLSIQFNAKDDWDKTMGRLLSPQAMGSRAVLIDNVKGRIDSDKLDALLTSPTIEGHQMYVGHTTRPNRLLVLMTANQPRLSADLSARAVVIRIGAAKWSDAGFAGWVGDHMERNRAAIVAGCLSILKAAGASLGGGVTLAPENRDRWARWQLGPLAAACWAVAGGVPALAALFPEGVPTLDQCAAEVMRRRGEVDDDAASAEDLADEIQKAIRLAGRNPETDSVHISHPVMAKILHGSDVAEDMNARQIQAWIGNLAGTGPLACLFKSRPHNRAAGRGWRWSMADAPAEWVIEQPGKSIPLAVVGDAELPI